MAHRIVFSHIVIGTVGVVLAYIQFSAFNRLLEVPFLLTIAALAVGIAIWVAIRIIAVKRELQIIEEQGIHEQTPYFAPALIALGLFAIFAFYFVSTVFPFWTFTINVILPIVPAYFFASALCYYRWESKNKRTLYQEYDKIYPQPPIKDAAQL